MLLNVIMEVEMKTKMFLFLLLNIVMAVAYLTAVEYDRTYCVWLWLIGPIVDLIYLDWVERKNVGLG